MMRLDWMGLAFTVLNISVWILIIYLVIHFYRVITKWIKKVNAHIDVDK